MIEYNSETEEICEIIMWITVVYKMELFKDSHVTIVVMILNWRNENDGEIILIVHVLI